MHKIKTNNGELTLVKISFTLYNVAISTDNYLIADTNDSANWQTFKQKLDNEYKIIATTSTLTEKQAKAFVEYINNPDYNNRIPYKNYNHKFLGFSSALESFNSLLEANGIDLTKNYIILKQLN